MNYQAMKKRNIYASLFLFRMQNTDLPAVHNAF